MEQDLITAIIVAVVSSAGLSTLVQFLIKRHDDKRGAIARIEEKLDNHIEENAEDKKRREKDDIIQSRRRIIRFSDEIYLGMRHSQDNFNSILEDDIAPYKVYCQTHPEFINDRANIAIARIQDIYRQCLEEHSFL